MASDESWLEQSGARTILAMRAWLVTAAALILCGCSEDDDRPAYQACGSQQCVGTPGGGSTPRSDAGSDSDAGGPTAVSITGQIRLLDGDLFDVERYVVLPGGAEVGFEAAAGGFTTVQVTSGVFTVEDVAVGSGIWASVRPRSLVDALATVQPIDTRAADSNPVRRDLLVVRASAIDGMLSVLSLPTVRGEGLAHAVLRFVDGATNAPVVGVSISARDAETVAYDSDQGWSDLALGSGARGLVLWANVTALPMPGTEHVLPISGAAQGSVAVQLAADAVTFMTVALSR